MRDLLDSYRIFEEVSFAQELLAAEFVFLRLFARQRSHAVLRFVLGVLAFTGLSFGFFGILAMTKAGVLPPMLRDSAFGMWYISFALLTMLFMRLCFYLTFSDALYICTAAYSLRYIVYVLVHELLARVVWPALGTCLPMYILLSFGCCAVLLWLVQLCFAPEMRRCGGKLFSDTPRTIATHIVLLALMMFCTFSCQNIFESWQGHQMLGAQLGMGVSALMLCVQYGALRAVRAAEERANIESMLRHSAEQYELTHELIDHINRSCHDLKHTISALKTVDEAQRQVYIEEAERNIERYHQLVHTDNEVLNTILAEKTLHCHRQNIRLSCVIDYAELDFVKVTDLYAMLGNAIDNAIECVNRFDDPSRRMISLTIRKQSSFACMQVNNYCDAVLRQEDGLPVTTKADALRHGHGLRSIRYLAGKYGGQMCTSVEDCVFILQIMLPIP